MSSSADRRTVAPVPQGSDLDFRFENRDPTPTSDQFENRDPTPGVGRAKDGRAELRFGRRGGQTVLAHSSVTAPMMVVRPFQLSQGRQLVQLITLGPGFCGGDRVHIQIDAVDGADVIVTTTAATRVLSMRPADRAEQHVRITAAPDATVQYYPLPLIPFPDSEFVQTLTIAAETGSRVGVLDPFAMGRAARNEYLRFRAVSSRTMLQVGGETMYLDATELQPARAPLAGAAVLAGRQYLASGVWYGLTIDEPPGVGASDADVLMTFSQSRPNLAYLRVLARDAPSLDAALRRVTNRVTQAWGQTPVPFDRFRC